MISGAPTAWSSIPACMPWDGPGSRRSAGWSPNCPITRTNAVAEVERYMAMPGQALAYKVGQLKITELRRQAESALGDRFDIKDFHRQVLADGSMPLTLLEQKIVNWISSQGS